MTPPDQNETESRCQSCGGHNPVWFAPNELWNRVTEDKALIICPVCFIKLAEAKGIRPTGWLLQEESRTVQVEILAAEEKAYKDALYDSGYTPDPTNAPKSTEAVNRRLAKFKESK